MFALFSDVLYIVLFGHSHWILHTSRSASCPGDFFLRVFSMPVLWNMLSARACRSENDKESFPMWSFSTSDLVGRNWPRGKNILPQALVCISWSLILLTCFLWSCLSEIFIRTPGSVTPLVLEKLDAENGRLGSVWKAVVWKSNFFLAERTCRLAALVSIPLESSDSLDSSTLVYILLKKEEIQKMANISHLFPLGEWRLQEEACTNVTWSPAVSS